MAIPYYGQNKDGDMLDLTADGKLKVKAGAGLPGSVDGAVSAQDSGKIIFVDASGAAGVQRDSSGAEVGYNDPFDPGGGEKDGGFIDGTNRRMDFMMGGLADLVDIYD